jgi:hypothetical protein
MTLPVVRMAFCDVTCGMCDIIVLVLCLDCLFQCDSDAIFILF